MKLAVTVVLCSLARIASADPIAADLRLDVNCADYWATPDRGVALTVDGSPVASHGIEGVDGVGYTRHGYPYPIWVPTDVGFTVPLGRHHISVAAPGCAALDTEIDAGFAPVDVSGRLPVSEPSLMGTTGAPNGMGLALGAYSAAQAARGDGDGIASYSYDATTVTGAWLSISWEHRNFALAVDTYVGQASTSGTARNLMPLAVLGESSAPIAFTGSEIQIGNAVRVGARMPLGSLALAAGSGLGVDVWAESASIQSGPIAIAAPETDSDFYVPVWASLTYKPTCGFGVQAMASYDIHPTNTDADAPALFAALLWQPNAACSEPAGLAVR